MTGPTLKDVRRYSTETIAANYPNRINPTLISGPYVPAVDYEALKAQLDEATKLLRDVRPYIPNAPYSLYERIDAFLKRLEAGE